MMNTNARHLHPLELQPNQTQNILFEDFEEVGGAWHTCTLPAFLPIKPFWFSFACFLSSKRIDSNQTVKKRCWDSERVSLMWTDVGLLHALCFRTSCVRVLSPDSVSSLIGVERWDTEASSSRSSSESSSDVLLMASSLGGGGALAAVFLWSSVSSLLLLLLKNIIFLFFSRAEFTGTVRVSGM